MPWGIPVNVDILGKKALLCLDSSILPACQVAHPDLLADSSAVKPATTRNSSGSFRQRLKLFEVSLPSKDHSQTVMYTPELT